MKFFNLLIASTLCVYTYAQSYTSTLQQESSGNSNSFSDGQTFVTTTNSISNVFYFTYTNYSEQQLSGTNFNTWTSVTSTGLPSSIQGTAVTTIDPVSKTVYLSYGAGKGLASSTDGVTWTDYGSVGITGVNNAIYYFSNAVCGLISNSTGTYSNCYNPTTGVATVTPLTGIPPDNYSITSAATSNDGTHVIMQLDVGGSTTYGTNIYSSTDGVTWNQVTLPSTYTPSIRSSLVYSNNILYLFGGQTAAAYGTTQVFVSTNNGATWTAPQQQLTFPFVFNYNAPVAYNKGVLILDETNNSTGGYYLYTATAATTAVAASTATVAPSDATTVTATLTLSSGCSSYTSNPSSYLSSVVSAVASAVNASTSQFTATAACTTTTSGIHFHVQSTTDGIAVTLLITAPVSSGGSTTSLSPAAIANSLYAQVYDSSSALHSESVLSSVQSISLVATTPAPSTSNPISALTAVVVTAVATVVMA